MNRILAGLLFSSALVLVSQHAVGVATSDIGAWQSAAPQPVSLVFLYDLTISVTRQPIAHDEPLKQMTSWVLAGLATGDTLRFGFVTRRLYLSRPYRHEELGDFYGTVVRTTEVPDPDRFGSSPLWDALDKAVAQLAPEHGRRAIVMVTDGRSTGNRKSLAEVVAQARAAGVSIWPVEFAPSEWSVPNRNDRLHFAPDPATFLREIAQQTGGEYYQVAGDGPASDAASLTAINSEFSVVSGRLKRHLRLVFAALHR